MELWIGILTCSMDEIYIKVAMSPLKDLSYHLVLQSKLVKVLLYFQVLLTNIKTTGYSLEIVNYR